jgi:autotransporter-associated beta strand protein
VWNQAGNWSPSGPPTINDTAQFDNTANASNLSPTIGNVATSVGAILFAAGTTNSYNITNGTGVLTIGSATVSGITNASATNQQISADILLGVSQTWNVQSTGNLTFTSAASIATGGNTLTLAGSSTGQGSIAGVISGTGSLIENGSGTWIITGANTFTGTTTVNGGTLLVNGAGELGSGAVTVNGSGTTLGGTATNLNRPSSITIGAGANLAPATIGTAGTLQIGSTLTLSPGSNFRVDLLGTGQGTTYDLLNGPGGGASGLVFAGSNLVLHVGIVTTTAQTFTILHQGGGFGGQQFAQGGFVLGDDLKVYSITYTGDNIILQWTGTIIPEPGTWLGGALGVVAVAFTQCRRLRKLMARRCVVGS